MVAAARLELDRKAGQGLDRIANLLLQLVIIIDHFVGTSKQTLPEAQRTQGIESLTRIFFQNKFPFLLAVEISQVLDSIPWVCCAFGNVYM